MTLRRVSFARCFGVLGTAVTAVALSITPVSAQTLELWFGFDGSSTGASGVIDFSGNGRNGTLVGTNATIDPSASPSPFGPGALRLGNNGGDNSNYVETTTLASDFGFANVNPAGYAASAWINLGSLGGSDDAMVFGNLSGNRLHDGVRVGNYHMGHWGNDTTGGTVSVDPALGADNWRYVTWEYAGGQQRIYENGVLVAGPNTVGPLDASGAGLPLVIGSNGDRGGFGGLIDDVTVYSLADGERLAANQIQHLSSGGDPTALPAPFNAPLLPATIAGPDAGGLGWSIRTVRGNGSLNSVVDAVNSINSGTGIITDGTAAVIDHSDPESRGGQGIFQPDRYDMVGDTAGVDDDDVAVVFKGTLHITPDQAGLHTFGMHSDDGMAVRFPGLEWVSSSGAGAIDINDVNRDTLIFNGNTGDSNTRGVIDLPAGDIPIEVVYQERGGGSFVELYSAPGSYQNDGDTLDWRLVGHKAGSNGDVSVKRAGVTSEGWSVTTSPAGGANINDLATAIAEVNAGGTSAMHASINFTDPDTNPIGGQITGDTPFDGGAAGTDDEDFALFATATLVIPEDGVYRFGFRGDDGGEFGFVDDTIQFNPTLIAGLNDPANSNVSAVTGSSLTGTGTANALVCDCLTGDSTTIGEVTLAAGEYEVYTYFWERGGGSYFEVFGSGEGNFGYSLLGADMAFYSTQDFDGLQLVPEPSSLLLVLGGLLGFASLRRRRR